MQVTIDAENNLISVYNNGGGIPVEMHKEENCWVPELIFGHLLTSSNYNDSEKKTTGGRNGYGAKLANIFSVEFTVRARSARGMGAGVPRALRLGLRRSRLQTARAPAASLSKRSATTCRTRARPR